MENKAIRLFRIYLFIMARMRLENAVEVDLYISLEEDRCNSQRGKNLLSIFLTILWSPRRLFDICREFYSSPYVGNEVGKITHHSSGEIPGHWPQPEKIECVSLDASQ